MPSPLHSDKIPITRDSDKILSPVSPLFSGNELEVHNGDGRGRFTISSTTSFSSPTGAVVTRKNEPLSAKYPVRVKTLSKSLSSGFPYHPVLFDLQIPPTKWNDFSEAIIEVTKLPLGDRVTVAATITGFAITGMLGAGLLVGKRIQDNCQLKRVKSIREEEAALGQVLRLWNDNYFRGFGIEAQLEVSEAVLRQEAEKAGEEGPEFVRRKKSIVEKTPLVFMKRELRDRRNEEKKYMIVLNPVEKTPELPDAENLLIELAADTPCISELSAYESVNELPENLISRHSPGLSSASSEEDPFADPPGVESKL